MQRLKGTRRQSQVMTSRLRSGQSLQLLRHLLRDVVAEASQIPLARASEEKARGRSPSGSLTERMRPSSSWTNSASMCVCNNSRSNRFTLGMVPHFKNNREQPHTAAARSRVYGRESCRYRSAVRTLIPVPSPALWENIPF